MRNTESEIKSMPVQFSEQEDTVLKVILLTIK